MTSYLVEIAYLSLQAIKLKDLVSTPTNTPLIMGVTPKSLTLIAYEPDFHGTLIDVLSTF